MGQIQETVRRPRGRPQIRSDEETLLILIEAAAPAAYLAIDIARDQLEATAAELARDFPALEVTAICASVGPRVTSG